MKIKILSILAMIFLVSYLGYNQGPSLKVSSIKLESIDGDIKLDDFKGKIILLYFGFLACPEACPTTLHTVAQAFHKLSSEELNQVQFIFVSLDPSRDSIEDLSSYTSFFHKNMIGVRVGDPKKLSKLARFYGIKYYKVDIDSGLDYTIDHSLNIILLDKRGNIFQNLVQGHIGFNNTLIHKHIKNALEQKEI